MLAITSVLCPVDFSEQSRRALAWAWTISRRRNARLTVVYVVDPLLAQSAEMRLGVDLAGTDAAPALREFVRTTLAEDSRLAADIRIEVTTGHPSDAILDVARSRDVGLIVMGTHGLGGVQKFLLGSTTEQVLRHTEWPVLAVPTSAWRAPDAARADVRLRTLLLATDFETSSQAATCWAAELANGLGASLVLAHVVEPVVVPPWWQPLAVEFEGDRAESGRRMLDRLAASVHNPRTDCVVSMGRAAETIAALATERKADVVVMGLTNGESTGRRPGSIAYRVLRSAAVPVVVVPAQRLHAVPEPVAGLTPQSSGV